MNRKLGSVLLALMLAACNLPGGSTPAAATSTPIVLPTTGSPAATNTAAPAEPATSEAPSGAPLEAIWIASPGAGSSVTSPVTITGQSRPTFEQHLVVAIYGEDGTLLARQPTIIAADAGSPGPYSIDLDFNVDHEQPGRIAVYETSAMDGGIVHLASVELTLLPSAGTANILPAPAALENMDITFPPANVEISGGSITVSGVSEYYFESQLGLLLCGGGDGGGAADDLCGDAHNVLAFSVAMIDSPDMGLPGTFSGTLTWSVSEATPGRIIVYGDSPRDGGLLHVTSIPVLILP
jgi:hypothetical protein